MKIILEKDRHMRIIIGLVLFLVLSSCAMVTSDSTVYIEGYVKDINGSPIKGAIAEYLGVQLITDEDGCFFFDGVYPPVGITVKINHPGYKEFVTTQKYGLYVFNITLVKLSTSNLAQLQISTITGDEAWKRYGCKST